MQPMLGFRKRVGLVGSMCIDGREIESPGMSLEGLKGVY